MRVRPREVSDEEVVAAVRGTWLPGAARVEYLPVGFGAHHWRVSSSSGTSLFVTLDAVGSGRTVADLAATYGAAAELSDRLEFVHAALAPFAAPLSSGGSIVGALSATPWSEGAPPRRLDRPATARLLADLHGSAPPAGLLRWHPLVDPSFAEELAASVTLPRGAGPFGEVARRALTDRLDSIRTWTAEYLRLARAASEHPWVPTHGEPGIHNQLVVDGRIVLVDWESLRLAPAERDTRSIGAGEPGLLRMFDLEWRLDEIAQYSAWFRCPHDGGEDDRIALAGLREELQRP